MKGLELARTFFERYKYDFLPIDSPHWQKITVGLVGHGSECWGFDDDISQDHDFECGFCVWLSAEEEQKIGFELVRAYARLPQEFMGFKRNYKDYYGGYHGIKTIEEFYSFYLPQGKVPQTNAEWLRIPDNYLAEATNGQLFWQGSNSFCDVRQSLKNMPRDVKLKKLASHLFYAAQSGQYNFSRCLAHGEVGAASLALNRFAEHVLHCAYLLNDAYAPYYKWIFKGVENLKILPQTKRLLEELLANPYDSNNAKRVDEICDMLRVELIRQDLSVGNNVFLEQHAYQVASHIKDSELRNSPIML